MDPITVKKQIPNKRLPNIDERRPKQEPSIKMTESVKMKKETSVKAACAEVHESAAAGETGTNWWFCCWPKQQDEYKTTLELTA